VITTTQNKKVLLILVNNSREVGLPAQKCTLQKPIRSTPSCLQAEARRRTNQSFYQ
jgi:hypothetical protein